MMTQEQRATEFAVFCIENVAARAGMSGVAIFHELMRTGGIDSFIYPSYPALHTQSKDFIVDEVMNYIRQNNPSFFTNETNVA